MRRTKTITRGAFKSPSKNREKNQTALTVFLGLLVLVFHPEFTAKLYWHSQTTLQAGFVRLFFISGVLSESRPGRRCFVLAFLGFFFCVLGGGILRGRSDGDVNTVCVISERWSAVAGPVLSLRRDRLAAPRPAATDKTANPQRASSGGTRPTSRGSLTHSAGGNHVSFMAASS